jgi:hypothetical protein
MHSSLPTGQGKACEPTLLWGNENDLSTGVRPFIREKCKERHNNW